MAMVETNQSVVGAHTSPLWWPLLFTLRAPSLPRALWWCRRGGGGEGRSLATAFILDRPKGPTLPHIPKGARATAVADLEKRLGRVLRSPNDTAAWGSLLSFARGLVLPPRGGGA